MNKLICTFLILALCPIAAAHAQQALTPKKLIQKVNAGIKLKSDAFYDIDFRHKSMLDNDTIAFKGRVYYSRSATKKEGCGKFLFYKGNQLSCFYDGTKLSNIYHEGKAILQYDSLSAVATALAGNLALENMIFMPFVEKRANPFNPENFQNALLSETDSLGMPCYVLEKTDSFPVDAASKIYPDDWDMGVAITRIYIRKVDYAVATLEQWVYVNKEPQYKSYEFSPLNEQHNRSWGTVSDTINSYLSMGYTLSADSKAEAEAPPAENNLDKAAILFSDQSCTFTGLDNETISPAELKGAVILLDFWYRSCMPCAKAVPSLKKLHEEFSRKGFATYAVNPYDKNVAQLKKYKLEKSIPYEIVLLHAAECLKAADIYGYPTFVLYDKRRQEVLFVDTGYDESIFERIKALLVERL